MKKISTALLLTTLVSGCSIYRESESISDKIARYRSKEKNVNPVPYIGLPEGKVPTTPKRSTAFNPVNSKHLYFTTLYRQFNHMKSYTTVSNELNHCPAFHNTFLKEKNLITNPTRKVSSAKIENIGKTSPLTSLIRNQSLELNTYVNNTLKELNEFCHTGTSLNYYNFANVMTHIKNNKTSFHADKSKSLRSLLKTTVFANKAIITGLKKVEQTGRFPASSNKNELLTSEPLDQALGTAWTSDMLKDL